MACIEESITVSTLAENVCQARDIRRPDKCHGALLDRAFRAERCRKLLPRRLVQVKRQQHVLERQIAIEARRQPFDTLDVEIRLECMARARARHRPHAAALRRRHLDALRAPEQIRELFERKRRILVAPHACTELDHFEEADLVVGEHFWLRQADDLRARSDRLFRRRHGGALLQRRILRRDVARIGEERLFLFIEIHSGLTCRGGRPSCP